MCKYVSTACLSGSVPVNTEYVAVQALHNEVSCRELKGQVRPLCGCSEVVIVSVAIVPKVTGAVLMVLEVVVLYAEVVKVVTTRGSYVGGVPSKLLYLKWSMRSGSL